MPVDCPDPVGLSSLDMEHLYKVPNHFSRMLSLNYRFDFLGATDCCKIVSQLINPQQRGFQTVTNLFGFRFSLTPWQWFSYCPSNRMTLNLINKCNKLVHLSSRSGTLPRRNGRKRLKSSLLVSLINEPRSLDKKWMQLINSSSSPHL